ncbi:MAG: lipase family alpha/beta hydrolase [Bradymonadia bacterium]
MHVLARVTGVLCLTTALVACGTENDTDAPEQPGASEAPQGLPSTKAEAADSTINGKADWSVDPCDWWGWYGDGSCDWYCWDHDTDCDAEPLFEPPADIKATHYPIVLAHGFDASPSNRWGFYLVPEALAADGHAVYIAEVPPYHSIETRAAHLAPYIDAVLEETGAEKVNLIAHSMGGLDGRYVISALGYGDRVATLTTISSPHQGSAVADFALKVLPDVFDRKLNALAALWGRTYSEVSEDADLRAALYAISTEGVAAFNAEHADDDRVMYQSWAGVSSVLGLPNTRREAEACGDLDLRHKGTSDRMHVTLAPLAGITAGGFDLTPNDGMVTVESAKWGAFRGCIPADHLDEVGQVKNEGADADTGFDAVRFYRTMAAELAEAGY